MHKYIHIKKANVIDPEHKRPESAQLLLKLADGRYRLERMGAKLELSEAEKQSATLYNAKGEYIFPGFVDMQCIIGDFQNKDFSSKWSELVSAMEGGYTTVCPLPLGEKYFDKKENLQLYLKELKKSEGIRVVPCLPLPKKKSNDKSWGISDLAEMGISILSDGGGRYLPSESMREIMKECRENDMLLICSAHDMTLVGEGAVNEGKMSRYFKLDGISKSAELTSVSRNLILAMETGCRIHIPSVSLKMTVDMIRWAKSMGVNVTASTSPQYFSCDENELLYRGAKAKIYPPLRSREDVCGVIEGIVDGTIDCIATDHISVSQGYKKDLKTAKFGSVGFETAFSASYTNLVTPGHIGIYDLVRLMSFNPRRILFGSDDERYIDGYISVDLDENKFYTKNSVKSVHWNSIFDGRDLHGVVVKNFNSLL